MNLPVMQYKSRKRRSGAVAVAVLSMAFSAAGYAQSACDLDGNGATNSADVSRAVNMALGSAPCTANVEGPQQCTVVTVQRVVNASLGQTCAVYNAATKTVMLTWLPSTSVGVTGYNIYRRLTPTGTYVKINSSPVTGTSFRDTSIQLGQTYYYAATSADNSGNESPLSSWVTAIIPSN